MSRLEHNAGWSYPRAVGSDTPTWSWREALKKQRGHELTLALAPALPLALALALAPALALALALSRALRSVLAPTL